MDESWKEEIKITVKQPQENDNNTQGITETMERIAQLSKSKHNIVHTYMENDTQVYLLRKFKEEAS